jgi:hypothetical protein
VATGNGDSEVPELPSVRGITGQPCLRVYKYGGLVLQVEGLCMRLTTSPCKKKFVENRVRKKKS